MTHRKQGRLLKPLESKIAGVDKITHHREGTRCRAERHATKPGQWVIWFGKEYAVVEAVQLPEVMEFI